ncbi:ferritin [Dysgonomonas sp. PH5-45]|uniref:ferritin n=1 Tax=unclassified Dysgonomonas TaxID=2630389 RepID=UPI002474605B|nr:MULTISPECIES: ferritin [unclassified Dysgonomonas]MDH6355727.1 ferritin [Dysgonomonas sp. PH5-45]MDH6388624.1 ferritin [Dysgonomonas sp. PH5-37]
MLNKKVEAALNAQVNAEFWAGYLYLSMSAHFAKDGKSGFANWFRVQAQEECDHAMKIFDFINTRGGEVKLAAIEGVPLSWESPLAAFQAALEHEKVVTKMIDDLVALARAEKDNATLSMLQWFVDEQVEEEESAQEYIDVLNLIGDSGAGLYSLDKELKARKYTPLED